MKKELAFLKSKISSFNNQYTNTNTKIEKLIQKTVVVIMSGPLNSERLSSKLPNGNTLIEMCIKQYADAGFNKVAALLFNKNDPLIKVLGYGSKYNMEIKYSYDPGPVGKGGAIKHAFENGTISTDSHFIVHNPNDVILNFKDSFPKFIMNGHLNSLKKGSLATVVVVEETPYPYTGMQIVNNFITDIEMYPNIPVPTHVGVTVFSPEVHKYFDLLFDLNLNWKMDFEKYLFPYLAVEKKLYALSIPNENWLPINSEKSYNRLLEML